MSKRPGPDPDRLISSELTDDTAFLLARARSICQGVTSRLLAPLDLRPRQYAVLTLACSPQAPTQRELATFLNLDPGQIVALVDPLEARGLVERRVDENDRRNKLIVATPAGRALQRTAYELTVEGNEESLAALDPTERETLRALLLRVAF